MSKAASIEYATQLYHTMLRENSVPSEFLHLCCTARKTFVWTFLLLATDGSLHRKAGDFVAWFTLFGAFHPNSQRLVNRFVLVRSACQNHDLLASLLPQKPASRLLVFAVFSAFFNSFQLFAWLLSCILFFTKSLCISPGQLETKGLSRKSTY